MTEETKQCTATAAACLCSKPAGHVEAGDIIHSCTTSLPECGGQWKGARWDAPDFEAVRYPGGATNLDDALDRLGNVIVGQMLARQGRLN